MPRITDVNKKIHIALTAEQNQFLQAEAKKLSVSVAAYVRMLILREISKIGKEE